MRNKRSKIDSAIAEAKALVRDNPTQATKLADWAFKEAQSKQHLKGQADALSIFAILFSESNPAASYDFSNTASEIYRQLGDTSCEAESLLNIASYYERSGWTCRSHFVLLTALELASQSNDGKLSATVMYDLGVNAEGRDELESALEYYTCAKYSAENAQHDSIYWRAVCAEQEMHYALANGRFELETVQKALSALDKVGMEKTQIEIEIFLSKVSHDQLDFRTAQTGLRRAYGLAETIGAENIKAEIICQVGENRLDDGKLNSAKKLLKIALARAQENGLRSLELSCLKLLSRAMAQMGDVEAALELLTTYSDIKEELHAHEAKIHFQEVRTSRDLQMLVEESKALKQTNAELAAVNERLESALREKRSLQKELERLATIDELTNALNRREIMACGSEIISRFHTQGRPGVVMIVDIDHFKSINDGWGHSAGDEVLRRFSRSCQNVLRPTDRFGRLGGEEFCILLDRTSLDIALKVAERVMNSIRASRVSDILGDRSITASIGIVEVSKKHKTIEDALQDADLGLYEAKGSGRDKICVTGVKKKKAA